MEKPRSILFVVLFLKGSTRILTDSIRHWNRAQYQTTLFLLTDEVVSLAEVPEGVTVLAGDYFSSAWRKLAGVMRIAQLSWKHDTIAAYAELTPTYMTFLGSILALKRPFGVVQVHLSTLLNLGMRPQSHRKMLRLLYPLLHRVIGCSDAVAEDLKNEFGLRNVVSVPNSVDLDRMAVLSRESVAPHLERFFDRPALMTIGMLSFQKGHDLLLQAFRKVVDAGYPHDLVIVGGGDGQQELDALAAALDLQNRVHFTGYVPNPYPLLRRADLFVLSSRFEGFALVLVEAMALGIPVVSTDCNAGPREVLADGRCGVLVPVEDPEALAEGIIRVLSDPSLAKRLREAGLAEAPKRDSRRGSELLIQALTMRGAPMASVQKS